MAILPQDPRAQKLVLVALLPLVLAAAYYMYVYSPKQAELTTQEAHADSLTTLNERARQQLARGNLAQLRAEAAEYEKSLVVMRTLVPTGNEVPALLEQVSTAARRVGLEVAVVTPEPVIIGDQFDTYRYKMQVTGGYHPVAEFLTNVGALPRIMAPINLNLTAVEGPTPASRRVRPGQAPLNADFYLQTYVAKTGVPAGNGA